MKVFEEIDFERVQVNKLLYFLYRNQTNGATDADSGQNQIIISNIDQLCGGNKSYSLYPSLETVQSIRHNVNSTYMFASVVYTLFLMAAVSFFNVVYVSYFMKEHQVPLIFRNPDSSIYYDTQRAKNLFFVVFIVLSGILGSLNFYDVGANCLHTYNEEKITSEFVDLYQYSLTALLWIVSIPLIFLVFMIRMRDNLKFGCYPFVIANIIFSFMLLILS